MHFDPGQLQALAKAAVSGLIGTIGGITRYFYDIDRGKRKFTFAGFFSTTALAFIAGVSVSEFLPDEYTLYGLTMVAGFYADYIVYRIGKRLVKQS